MSLHKRIRDGRNRLGLTEQQFADRLGVTRPSVQQWEKEGGTAPNRKRQPDVAKLLGMSVGELMSPLPDLSPRAPVGVVSAIHQQLTARLATADVETLRLVELALYENDEQAVQHLTPSLVAMVRGLKAAIAAERGQD